MAVLLRRGQLPDALGAVHPQAVHADARQQQLGRRQHIALHLMKSVTCPRPQNGCMASGLEKSGLGPQIVSSKG